MERHPNVLVFPFSKLSNNYSATIDVLCKNQSEFFSFSFFFFFLKKPKIVWMPTVSFDFTQNYNGIHELDPYAL